MVIVRSDPHWGSTLGLCPPEGVRISEGAKYLPGKAQRWLWSKYLTFIRRARTVIRQHDAIHVDVWNGDAFDGDHHNTSQIVSRNPENISYIANRASGKEGALKDYLTPAQSYVVIGTEIHVGKEGASEEAFGKSIGAIKDPGRDSWAWWHLRLEYNGVLLDFTHHPDTSGNLPHTRGQGAQRQAFIVWAEHHLVGERHPDISIRSHKHVFADSGEHYPTRALITPAWQLKTQFGFRVASGSLASVGGLIIVIPPDGQYRIEKCLYRPDLPQPMGLP